MLDTVIGLRKPPDYQADQGARFEIHFEKARGFYGPEAEPFEARLIGEQWEESEIKSGDDLDTLNALRQQGYRCETLPNALDCRNRLSPGS